MTAAQVETDYEAAVTEQLRDLGSVTVPAEALAFLLGAAARAPEVPHDDMYLLWRALSASHPTLAAETFAGSWNRSKPKDRLALACIVANVPAVDPNIITNPRSTS